MKENGSRPTLIVVTAVLVCLIALTAAASLWFLRRTHSQVAHMTAARSVLEQGRLLARYVCADPAVTKRDPEHGDWQRLSAELRAIHLVENALQYVSVARDGVTVFHEQTTALDGSDARPPNLETTPIRVRRHLLHAGETRLPVLVVMATPTSEDGKPVAVEVGLRRDALQREERSARNAIDSMFRVALTTVGIAFAVCVVLVVWMMQREAERERSRREQEHLTFAGVLANGIAHDFRNPMSAVRLDVQMLEREASRDAAIRPERIRDLAGRVRSTVDRMDNIFREFLFMSRPPREVAERLSLNATVAECVEMMGPRLESSGVRLQTDQPQQEVAVLAHGAPLRRAILNVLVNAEQFSRRGDTVSVRISRSADSGVVDVIDEGPGIPKSDRQRVFRMFVSSRPGGTGLGLFLAKSAVERSGGSICIMDGNKGGAWVRLCLPLWTETGATGAASGPLECALPEESHR